MTIITNPGRLRPPEIRNVPILYITHHVLSRSAQRLGLQTTKDLQMMCELRDHERYGLDRRTTAARDHRQATCRQGPHRHRQRDGNADHAGVPKA